MAFAAAGDDVGRADRAAATAREKVHSSVPRIRSGAAPRGETGHPDRRDVLWRSLLRRHRRAPFGGMKSFSAASMQPRRSKRCCGSSPSVTPDDSNRCSASIWWPCAGGSTRHPTAGVRRHRFAAAPGLRARQTMRLLRSHQDRRNTDSARKELSPSAATIGTSLAPMIAGMRLPTGQTPELSVSNARGKAQVRRKKQTPPVASCQDAREV